MFERTETPTSASHRIVKRRAPYTRICAPYVDTTSMAFMGEIWEVPNSEFYRYRVPMVVVARVAAPIRCSVSERTGRLVSRVQLVSENERLVCKMDGSHEGRNNSDKW